MADKEIITNESTVAAPTAETIVATPVTEIIPSSAETVEKTTQETPVVETPKETVKEEVTENIEQPADKKAETIIGQALEEAKTDEIKPADETKAEQKDEGNLTDDPAPLPEFEPFTLPEGFVVDEKKLGEFNKELAEFEVNTKADHAAVQALGQKLLERYTSELQRMQENHEQGLSKIKSDWKEAFRNDPELGGNRINTTKKILMEAINGYAGSPEHVKSLGDFVEQTGIGDNPDLARLIVNQQKTIQNYKDKYESEDGIKILAGTKPEQVSEKVWNKLFGGGNTASAA